MLGTGMTEVKNASAGARRPPPLIRQRPGLRIALLSLAWLIVASGAAAVGGFACAAHPHPAVSQTAPASP
jgi:hypothetical protein